MQGPVTRRRVLQVLGIGAAGGLLAACSPTSEQAVELAPTAVPTSATAAPTAPIATAVQTAAGSQRTETAVAQPKSGGTLRVAIGDSVTTLDGHYLSQGLYDNTWLIWDRLTQYDGNMQPQPQLAESWDISTDYKQIKLNLRKSVLFHTGREFTSDDVKYNFLRVRDPKANAASLAPRSAWFTTIDTPDKYTVVLTSDVPRLTVFDFFEYFNMEDRDTLEGPDAQTAATGTGPYKLVEWVQGDHLTLEKNSSYWQAERLHLDRMVFSTFRDLQSMVVQFESGQADVVKNPLLNDYVRLKSDAKYQATSNPLSGNFNMTGVNVQNPPLDNKLVRQALNWAMDRQRFAHTVLLDQGKAESLPWLSSSPAYEESKENFYSFDLDRARALLAQAGVQGFEMDFLLGSSGGDPATFAQMFQQDIGQIGVTVNLKLLDTAALLNAINNRTYQGMYFASQSGANLSPSTIFTTGRGFDPQSNNSGFASDEYDQILMSAASELDQAKRQMAYSQLNDFVLDQAWAQVISSNPGKIVFQSNVHGIGYTMHEGFAFDGAWLA